MIPDTLPSTENQVEVDAADMPINQRLSDTLLSKTRPGKQHTMEQKSGHG